VSPFRLGVFASGGGSNLQSLLDHIRSGQLPADMAFVLSNNSKSGALTRARDFGIPAYHDSAATEGDDEKATIKILEIVRSHKIDLLVLAGYMKKVPQALLAELPNRMLNIHPALPSIWSMKLMMKARLYCNESFQCPPVALLLS